MLAVASLTARETTTHTHMYTVDAAATNMISHRNCLMVRWVRELVQQAARKPGRPIQLHETHIRKQDTCFKHFHSSLQIAHSKILAAGYLQRFYEAIWLHSIR